MWQKKIDIVKIARKYGAVIFFFLLFLFNCVTTTNFIRINTIQNLFIQSFPILLISFGMTLVIATANIDISVGSGMALAAMIFALTISAGMHSGFGIFGYSYCWRLFWLDLRSVSCKI